MNRESLVTAVRIALLVGFVASIYPIGLLLLMPVELLFGHDVANSTLVLRHSLSFG
jgi:hypothetical protein